jgi:uncharacterized protein YjbI with pentapeptide repeats
MRPFFVLLCVFLLAGCGPTSVNKLKQKTGARIMAPAEVLSLIDSNTLFLHSFQEDSYFYFDHSGKLFAKDIQNNKDIGNWDVSEDGELCMRMNNWWYGDLLCFQVLSSGTTYHLANTSGVLQYSGEQFTGDARHLFYTVKRKKKSYRRSLRAKKSVRGKQGPEMAARSQNPQEKTTDQYSRSITEELTASEVLAEKDLHSTVKWMARDCPGCNLAETDLKKADLVGAQLMGANLRGAMLKMSNLRRANLEGANLEGANLSYANMPGANLKNANLTGANLKGANLIRANLTGAKLDGADLTDALLESVRGLKR